MVNQPRYQLNLLGSLSLQLADEPNKLNAQGRINLRRKNRALLAYLMMGERPFPRHHLTTLFTANAADPLHALRVMLSRLRRQLDSDVLVVHGDTVQLNHALFATDTAIFATIADWSATAFQNGEWERPFPELTPILSLYRGDFLADIQLPDAPPEYETWLLVQRSHWRQLYERGALALIQAYIVQQMLATATETAQKLIQHNPLLEEAHYQLIWLYAQTEQTVAALQQYDHCRAILSSELAVEPMPALVALRAEIVSGRQTRLRPQAGVMEPSLETVAETTVFVERKQEMVKLQAMWTAVQNGQSGVVLVDASAGGGKTCLLQTFGAQLPTAAFLVGDNAESTRSLAYHPWSQLLAGVLDGVDECQFQQLPAYWQAELTHLLPSLATKRSSTHPDPAQHKKEQLFAAVYALMQCASHPLCLFVDDLQWADTASLELLHYVATRAMKETAVPLLLVGAYRSEEAEDNSGLQTLLHDWSRWPDVTRLSLPPLSTEAIVAIWQALGAPLPSGTAVAKATGGNPLFVVELARELAHHTELPAKLPVPSSMAALIQRRLGQLPAHGQQVLETIAILNQPAPFDVLRQICARSEDETLQALELGLQRRLLVITSEQSYQIDFSHDLMAQAVQEQLSPIRRQLLHRRAAITLKQREAQAATLAYHWRQAGDVTNEVKWAVAAATEAATLYANDEALHYFQRVLALQPTAAIWRQLGDVQKRIGQWDEAETAYQSSLQLAQAGDDGYETAVSHLALGKFFVVRGGYETAVSHLNIAASIFDHQNCQLELADVYNNLAIVAYRQSNYQAALDHYHAAAQIDELLNDKKGLLVRLGNIGLVYLNQGNLDEAQHCLEQSLQLAQSLDHQEFIANRLGNLGIVASNRGDYDGALHYYERAVAIDEALGNTQAVARHIGNMGYEYYLKRETPQAMTYWLKALGMEQAMGNGRAEARVFGNLGTGYRDAGDFSVAERCLAQALQMDMAAGHRDAVARHIGNLAILYQWQAIDAKSPIWEQAEMAIQPAIHLTRQLNDQAHLVEYLLAAAQLMFETGRWTQTVQLVQECLSLAQKLNRGDVALPVAILD
ncbi:MAG: tetratricopeptide repeat protein, partial [bacterium]|nr:tetratricopeptide repeat protein [bacterium]